MTESIRAYWRGREAALPLDALSPEHRSPLRVLRSVLGRHVPDALHHLEQGNFFALAWPEGDRIRMILCHPNLAKGNHDRFCLDTRELPRVVLTLPDWNAAPGAAWLFLRAFGAEAVSPDDCAAARRALVEWLRTHAQPEMAQIVQRYSSFPLGVRSDALEVIDIWRHILIKGQKEQIDQVIAQIGQRFEALGWRREAEFERHSNRSPDQIGTVHCWSGSAGNGPEVLLSLARTTAPSLRGGTYNLLEKRASIADLANAMQFAMAEVLEPSAQALGLAVSYPRLGPISKVRPATVAAMTAFAEAADGRSPLPDEVQPLWRIFTRTAYQDAVAISPDELTAWFIANGWEDGAASELTERFYTEVASLAECEEAGRQVAWR
jgi:hypothetical protein